MGQRKGFSEGDIDKLNNMYCENGTEPSTSNNNKGSFLINLISNFINLLINRNEENSKIENI